MNVKVQVFSFVLNIFFLLFIINKVRRHKLSEKESIHWFLGVLLAFSVIIQPQLLDKLAYALGISYPPALLFLIAVVFLFGMTFVLTMKVSELRVRNTELAQNISLMEKERSVNFDNKEKVS